MKLETERLILREFKEEDANDLFEYLHAPTVNCFIDMKIDNIEDTKKEIINRMKDKSGLYLAIVLKKENKVIGEVFSGPEASDPLEIKMDTYSPCWMLNTSYQAKGYAFEAIKAYFDYLFNVLNARRIYIYTEDYNLSCQKLCKKLNMRQEGFFKEFVSFINDCDGNPVYENTLQFAILKTEWNSNKKIETRLIYV